MDRHIKKTTAAIADFLPGLISGAQLEFFSKSNITNSQFIALMAVFHADRCTMGFLAKRLHVSTPTVTGLIDRLIKLGLVERIPSEKDRRKIYIEVTKKGNALIKDFKGVVRRRWGRLLAGLSPMEVETFRRIFEKLRLGMEGKRDEKQG